MKRYPWRYSLSSFTLIELLIVVAIIGILAAIAVPNFLNAQTRSRLAQVYGNFASLRTAIGSYMVDNNEAPVDLGGEVDDGRTFVQLTTPIAYVSGIDIARDIFQPKNQPRKFYDYGGRIKKGENDKLGPGDRGLAYDTAGIRYVILSSGPDGDTDYGWTGMVIQLARQDPAIQHVFYSASNGLISSGDIIGTDSKIFKD
ncbi:MAG: prepilin-type N-terminal cleavage/methylation domain-containing protein [bacterium]